MGLTYIGFSFCLEINFIPLPAHRWIVGGSRITWTESRKCRLQSRWWPHTFAFAKVLNTLLPFHQPISITCCLACQKRACMHRYCERCPPYSQNQRNQRIQELLSTLNMNRGYWQWTCSWGIWNYYICLHSGSFPVQFYAFWMKNTPATIQKLMERIL